MRSAMMVLGLVRILVGRDYRSRGKRRQLRRMGRELIAESMERLHHFEGESPGEMILEPHPNAPSG